MWVLLRLSAIFSDTGNKNHRELKPASKTLCGPWVNPIICPGLSHKDHFLTLYKIVTDQAVEINATGYDLPRLVRPIPWH